MVFQKRKGPSPDELEIARIINLPTEGLLDKVDTEVFCFESLLATAFDEGERLWQVQASAVQAYRDHGGLLAPIYVGDGKTGISLMIANTAFTQGIQRSMLIIPPAQVHGLIHRHLPEWRKRVPIDVPFHYLHGRSPEERQRIAESGMPGCYVMPYSLLSRPEGEAELHAIAPELIIADEVHYLKNQGSARGGRVHDYLMSKKPQFVGMSGTISSKSLKDYHHLLIAALRDGAPIPIVFSTMRWIDDVINCFADETTRANDYGTRLMRPYLLWARENFPDEDFTRGETESYRRAFRHRFLNTPGVVASGLDGFGVSIGITNVDIPEKVYRAEPGFSELEKFLADVDDPMITPNGDDIDHGFHKYKWKRELAGGGFYHLLGWPTPAVFAKRRKMTEDQAEDILTRAEDYQACQQDYARHSRQFFKRKIKGIDTPLLLSRFLARADKPAHLVGQDLHDAWREMKKADFEGRPDRDKSMVRVCPFKVNATVRWAEQFKTGIIWVWHPGLGRWIMEALEAAGLDAVWCPAGNPVLIESLGDPLQGGQGDCIAVASIGGHGTGRNLQAFERCLLLEFPREPIQAEQTIGRIHRPGQVADHVNVYTMLTLEFDHHNRAACLNDSIYLQQTTGQRRKVVYADYDPLPKVFTREFLREQGIDGVSQLNQEQRKMLKIVGGN